MKKFLVVLAIILVAMSACGALVKPAEPEVEEPVAEPTPELTVERAKAVVYDVDYAHRLCGDRPVDVFAPATGYLECARWGPTSEPKKQPEPTVVLTGTVVVTGSVGFNIVGVSDNVDLQVVLHAQGADDYGNVFTNTVGLGSEMMLAEPGTILMGPDFSDSEMVNNSPHMDWISPVTQFTLNNPGLTNANAAEGAFLWFTGAMTNVSVRDVKISLEGKEGHNWFLIIRGLFEDGKQDSDRNSTVVFEDYVPGHAQVMLYPPGAYISEGNFLQVVELSHTGGRNCGAEGCSELSVLFLDLNTNAYVIIYQPELDADWQFVASNWRTS